ncbi:hypothetical protein Tdes44962_MAKER04619 [Teratosphaeria destructans]|uniref:Uncharacterized protein n=1 Tax=Teratosphaeria destructans TaxID=418781 RepID=A0A9W7SM58_9PEZI|nr:hypothetical protein Tdes44962_MAKER04619 [Teratosphaeria destructans]
MWAPRTNKRRHSDEAVEPLKRKRPQSPEAGDPPASATSTGPTAPAAPVATFAPAGVMFHNLVSRPKDAIRSEEERAALREIDSGAFDEEEEEDVGDDDDDDDDDGSTVRGTASESGGESEEGDVVLTSTFGGDDSLELEGVPKRGASWLKRQKGLHRMRQMWQADPADVLDASLVPKEKIGDDWVAKASDKWPQDLLLKLGELCRYGGHQEMNGRLLAVRDKRVAELTKTNPGVLGLKVKDVHLLICTLETEEGRSKAATEDDGRFWI